MEQYKNKPLLLTLLCGYIFLITDRPWESISYLHGMRIQFLYAIVMIVVAAATGRLVVREARTNFWVFGLLALHFLFAPFAFSGVASLQQGFEYFKIVLLYILMISVVDDETDLRILLRAFVFSAIVFCLHSLWEFHNGKFVYRMGIVRMVGVGEVSSSPNGFGATLVLAVPFAYVLARCDVNKWVRLGSWSYILLLVPVCVVMTGSRSAFVAMIFCVIAYVVSLKGWKKYLSLLLALIIIGGGWQMMPVDKKVRIETIWDKDIGPENAHQSAQGRIEGMIVSIEMFKEKPLTGVGAGKENYIGYRVAMGESAFQSHILYGEVLSEFGVVGVVFFLGLVLSIGRGSMRVRRWVSSPRDEGEFIHTFAGSIVMALILLLILGLAGHNFYRYLWLFLAAWTSLLIKLCSRPNPTMVDAKDERHEGEPQC